MDEIAGKAGPAIGRSSTRGATRGRFAYYYRGKTALYRSYDRRY